MDRLPNFLSYGASLRGAPLLVNSRLWRAVNWKLNSFSRCYNGGQKWSWILSTMGGNDCFFGHNIGWTIAGGLGGWQDEPLLGEWRDDRMNHYWGEWGTTGWTIVGGVFGDDRMNHCWGNEGNTGKLSLGVERYLTGFSTQSQVPLSPIVVSQVVVFVSSRYAPGPSCSNAG